MDKITSREQLFDLIADVRNAGDRFTTNFFWDEAKHGQWISEGSLTFRRRADGCLLLFHDGDGFHYLFYVAPNLESLATALPEASSAEGTLVADVVTKAAAPAELALFEAHGFALRRKLFRMVRIGAFNADARDAHVRYAAFEDISAIRALLLEAFDKLSEQIPSEEDLKRLVSLNGVYLYRLADETAGLLISQTTGQTWYLRYWLVKPQFRGRGVGSALFRCALARHPACTRQILWVAEENAAAGAKYEHYGFRRDRLNDYVLIKK